MKTYISFLLQLAIVLSFGLQVSVAQDVDNLAEAASKGSTVPLPLDVDELNLLWETTAGDIGSETVASLDQTNDGGYIFVGNTNSKGAGGYDVYMVKTDYFGNILWERTHGGSANDYGYSVEQTSEGGYIIAGTTSSFGAGSRDGYLIKTSPAGTIQWYNTFGGTQIDEIYSVQETSDYGYILAGKTESFDYGSGDVFLVKTDSSGNMLWKKHFGGTSPDTAAYVRETSDQGFIICGSTSSFEEESEGFTDFYIVRTNSEGQLLWEKTYGSTGWSDEAHCIQETSDGGFIVTGALRAYSIGTGTWDIGLIKLDEDGNLKWSKQFGGTGRDVGKSVQETTDGGYIILAETNTYGAGSDDMYLIKTNSSGIKEWDMLFGGTGSDRSYAIETTYEGGYVIAGTTDSYGAGDNDFYLIRLGNFRPIANAGGDQTVYADSFGTAEVYLDASDSNDPEGDPLTYRWYWWVDGISHQSDEMTLTIILPIGEHLIELEVNDGRQDSFTEEITVTVEQAMEGDLWVLPRPIKRNRGSRRLKISLCPPEDIEPNQIDIDKPLTLYPGGIQSDRQRIRTSRIDGVRRTYAYAFFDKVPLMEAIPDNGNADLTVIGNLITGQQFYGLDTVLIIERIGRDWDSGESKDDDDGKDDNNGDTGDDDPNSIDDGKDNPKDDGKTDDKDSDQSDDKNNDNIDQNDDDSGNSANDDTDDNKDDQDNQDDKNNQDDQNNNNDDNNNDDDDNGDDEGGDGVILI